MFIVKHTARGAGSLDDALAALSAHTVFSEISIKRTQYAGHAIDIARENASSVDLMVAVGGDGTLNEVVNGCMAASGEAQDLPYLGIVAGGTANDFLKSTPLSGTLAEVVKLAAEGSTRPVDLGLVEYTEGAAEAASRYFINVADLGIGANVARRVNESERRFGASIAYSSAIVGAFLSYRKPDLQLNADDGWTWQGKSLACVIGNGRCFGAGLCAVPQARIDDGRLSAAIIGDVSLLDFLLKLPKLKRCQPISHPEVEYHQARSLRISSGGQACAMELDGEYLECGDVSVSVIPAALTILMP